MVCLGLSGGSRDVVQLTAAPRSAGRSDAPAISDGRFRLAFHHAGLG